MHVRPKTDIVLGPKPHTRRYAGNSQTRLLTPKSPGLLLDQMTVPSAMTAPLGITTIPSRTE